MKKSNLNSLLIMTSVLLAVEGRAQIVLTSEAYSGFVYDDDPNNALYQIDSNSSNDGSSATLSSSAYDEDYQFTATSSATASSQSLKAQAVGALNAVNTGVGFDVFTNSPDGLGNPDTYVSSAKAAYSETLTYGGTAVHYNSRYILNFTGTIEGYNNYAVITLQHANNAVQQWVFSEPGDYNETLVSNAFVHGQFPQDFSLSIQSTVNLNTLDGAPQSGEVDLGHTLNVVGIDLRDNTGALLTGDSVTGESGSVYNIVAVPEPSSGLLFLLGASSLALRRSRR